MELVAAISMATDLGTGQPVEHALRTCRLSMAVAQELGLDARTAADVPYVALLRFLGCTADAPQMAHYAGGDNIALIAAMAPVYMGSAGAAVSDAGPQRRPGPGARTPGPAAGRGVGRCAFDGLALRGRGPAGCPARPGRRCGRRARRTPTSGGTAAAYPTGWPGRRSRSRSGWWSWRAMRCCGSGSPVRPPLEVLARRRGRAYDPTVVDAVGTIGVPDADDLSVWEDVLAAEPAPVRRVGAVALDRALAAVGDFADLRSTWTRGRSTRLAETARAAGRSVWATRSGGDRPGSRRAGGRPRRGGRADRGVGAPRAARSGGDRAGPAASVPVRACPGPLRRAAPGGRARRGPP